MIGGRILGQGTYGCVFQPSLECRGNKKDKDNTMVGKITSKKDAKNEIAIAKILKKIPNSSNYTIVAEVDKCTPRAKSRQSDTDIQACEFSKDEKLENTIQILMPWGGQPLSRLNLHPRRFNFYKFTEDLLSIGTFLVLNDLCHFDIWGQNLLFDKENKPRLIDFGFAFEPSKLEISDLPSRWRIITPDHDTETPEVNLMVASQSEIPITQVIESLRQEKPVVRRLSVICDVSPGEWASELKIWTEESQSFQQRDWLRCWKTYWPGFDAWSIGAVLLSVLETQMRFKTFQTSRAWQEKGTLIKTILKGMCHPHPAYRYDAVEALNFLTKGTHPLISSTSVFVGSESTDEPLSGQEWIQEKKARRQLLS
jgi:serine/threonine protein kinase